MEETDVNGGNAKAARDISNLQESASMSELQESENKTAIAGPSTEPSPGTSAESAIEPVAKSVARSAAESAAECAAESAAESAAVPAAVPIVDPVAAPVAGTSAAGTSTADMADQDLNDESKATAKKTSSTGVKTKSRKFKANLTSNIENEAITLSSTKGGRKRKLSEPDDGSSEESTGFSGFDLKVIEEVNTGSHILKKLIAEAEMAEAQLSKRYRYMVPKKSVEGKKDDDQDSDENKMSIYDMEQVFDMDKIKKEKESDPDSILNITELDVEQKKTEESPVKSINSMSTTSSPSTSSLKSRGGRVSRGTSPGSALKQKAVVDMSNPAFKEPFKYGWKRELVFRASNDSSLKRMADIYYYTPKGKKVRSFREVSEYLHSRELTIDNFTFFKEPIGLDDPEKEIIRDAKRMRGSIGSTPTPPRRSFGTKKAAATRKPVEESVPAPSPSPSPAPAVAAPQSAVAATPAKTPAKSPKAASSFKVKVPAKKTPQIKMKPPVEEKEMLPPQRNPTSSRRSQQSAEKATPSKTKRSSTPKIQEPCSIRCSTSMGLIPSLQCRVCLCLYHPECVDGLEFSGSDDYICKNCQQDSTEQAHQHQSINPTLTPPPLIPISMLNTQNTKQKQQANLSPPKLQRIPKSETIDIQQPSCSGTSKYSKTATVTATATTATATASTSSASQSVQKENPWFPTEDEFMQSHDRMSPLLPAQNIAVIGGRKYIVIPKNNSMSVQPAITMRHDKFGERSSMFHECSSPIENMIVTKVDVPPLTKASGGDDTTESDNDKELSKEMSASCGSSDDTNETIDSHMQLHSDPCCSFSEARKITRSPHKRPMCTMAMPSDLIRYGLTKEMIGADVTPIEINPHVVHIGKRRKHNQQELSQQSHFMENVCIGYHSLLRIFQYLKVQELLRASRVCKMWRDLASHPSLWRTVRMKNSQVTDWDGFADALQKHNTQHLDLRKMLITGDSDAVWKKFISVIPKVTSLIKLELCRCPVMVVEEVIKNCPQLQVLSAMTIKCDSLNLQNIGNLKQCQELRLKAISGMSLQENLVAINELTQLTQLSLTSVKELGKKKIEIIQTLTNLETLELGECSDFPDKFGTSVLIKLQKLERLRLEKGQGSCCTFDILEGVSKLDNLSQMELVNFDVKNGFDKCLANCKNIKRLLIIPTYISQSATSNNMVLGGVTELSHNLTHFVWGVTLELLRVTELFVDQCNLMKQGSGDSIPVLKPVPCLRLIEDVDEEPESPKEEEDEDKINIANPQVDILPLPQLQKLLLTALPKTRVKILKIPFHATWRQSISDTTTQ